MFNENNKMSSFCSVNISYKKYTYVNRYGYKKFAVNKKYYKQLIMCNLLFSLNVCIFNKGILTGLL